MANAQNKNLSKTFCIVRDQQEQGTSTLESYLNHDSALKAFDSIKAKGYHIDESSKEKITMDKGDSFSLDVEVWDLDANHCEHEAVVHVPFTL